MNWDNKEEVLKAINDREENFEFASYNLKNDKEFVLEVLNNIFLS